LGCFSQFDIVLFCLFESYVNHLSTMNEDNNFISYYVNLPHSVHIAQADDHLEMINILTPIINVDDKKNHFNTSNIKGEVTYDVIITQDTKSLGTDLELNLDKLSKASPDGECDVKRHERLQKDIHRKKMARMRESLEQRLERLKKDRVRKKRARQNETLEQRQSRLEKDRVRIQKRRALESDEERQRRLEKNRISKRKARLKENSRIGSD